jgi:cyanophycinase
MNWTRQTEVNMFRAAVLFLAAAPLLLSEPAPAQMPTVDSRGNFILAGGGRLDPAIRRRFIELAGGARADIVLIPCAIARSTAATNARASWQGEDVHSVQVLDIHSRDDANDPRVTAVLRKATGVWFGGGDQGRLLALCGETRVETELHALLQRGGVVGGTSAGASCVTGVMVHGRGEKSGFGLLPGLIVDQHFSQRNRLSRLQRLLEKHPKLIGLGIDEGTALVIQDGRLSVLGRGNVTVCSQPDHTVILPRKLASK